METKKFIKQMILFLAIPSLLTMISSSGILNNWDCYVSDAIYQKQVAIDDDIVIISIDEKSLKEYGNYQDWNREKIAETILLLNKSEDCHPAAIAIDVLYGSKKEDKTDAYLAEAAGRYNNVITASLASFNSDFVENNNDFSYDNFFISSYEEPYEQLKSSTIQGHINAMLDRDGILRHHLLSFNLRNGETIQSMALATALKYDENIKLPETTENGFWYLPYSKKPGNFESISIFDVLNNKVPVDYFNGKIVLIGPMAMGLQDNYFTSIDHASPMYGVEYQANAISALLNENFKNEDNKIQYIILFFVLFIICIVFSRKNIKIVTLLWLLLSTTWFAICEYLYSHGTILHALYLPLYITIIYIGAVAFHAIQDNLKKKKILNTFERYVAPEIVTELLKSDDEALKLVGKSCKIAVLFVDIRGFTTMSEKLKPETVVEILNQYLTLISDCIFKHNGTLDKYVGDAVMAFWGAPLPQDDYVMNAAKAALDMASAAKELSSKLEKQYEQKLAFGIGINVGEAVVGNIGSPKRMDYTAIGDTVNTAARLEANAPGNTVFISKAVVDMLGKRINATILENPPKLKGKSNNFEIFTLDSINY